MTTVDTQLQELLESGDDAQCIAFFKGMEEAQRRALAPACLAFFRKVQRNAMIETTAGTFTANARLFAATYALFATANHSELKKIGWRSRPQHDVAFDILCDRRPSWVAAWASDLLHDEYYWAHWQLIRRLINAGLIERPDHPNYYLGMISGLRHWHNDKKTIAQLLRNDPELLEHEIWRLFEYEGSGENSLANFQRFGRGGNWMDGFLALMRSGDLPRERLLSCSLDALQSDFNHYRAKWFFDFHDALEPTAAEQREFAERYLGLLSASAPNVVTWAYKQVEALCKKGAYDAGALCQGLIPVLQARQKGIAVKALKLLARIADQSPQAGQEAARAAAVALTHEAPEVQAAALAVVTKWGSHDDDELVASVADSVEVVAPSQREQVAGWLAPVVETAAPPTAAAIEVTIDKKQLKSLDNRLRKLMQIDALEQHLQQGNLEIPAATFDGTDIARLNADQKVSPITDVDELIDVCARVIEDGSNVEDVERAIDGISRLCTEKPKDFDQRIAPLLKRATQRLKKDMLPFGGIGPDDDMCGLIYAWATGRVLEGKPNKRGGHTMLEFEIDGEEFGFFSLNLKKPIGFLAHRSLAVARRVAAGTPVELLSAPTHSGCWIDAGALTDRMLARRNDEPDLYDVCLAMLRTAPEGRREALKQLKKLTAEWALAVRYALGDDNVQIGNNAPLWITASRARGPWTDDASLAKKFRGQESPDALTTTHYDFNTRKGRYGGTQLTVTRQPAPDKRTDVDFVTTAFHVHRSLWNAYEWEVGGFAGRTPAAVKWTTTIWPQARESFFAAAAEEMVDNLDWSDARWQNKCMLEPLLDAGTPLRHMGLLLLTAVLAAKEPGEHGLATDIAIRSIQDGRLGSDNLGSMMARLLPSGLIKAGRWQATLSEVARISHLHAAVVHRALQHCFVGASTKWPRDFAKLLELLHELSIQLKLGIDHAECRKSLQKISGSGKAAKTAKAVLALTHNPSSVERLLQLALQQRIEAASARQLAS